jgi:DNA helicase-2/ATP-dependent DNA helicase PcrA
MTELVTVDVEPHVLAARLGKKFPPTPEQAAVIAAPMQPMAIIAGAGAGKTETMAARVMWLVANRKVEPQHVLGLTFTRKAAAELGRRIRRELAALRNWTEREEPENTELIALLHAQEPTVLTYAAYAGQLVAEQGLRVGYEPQARLLAPAMLWQVADRVVRRWDQPLAEFAVRSSLTHWVIAMAGQMADHLVEPAQVEAFCAKALSSFYELPLGDRVRSEEPTGTKDYITATKQRAALVRIVGAFQAEKARIGAVDFGDQMRAAAELAALDEVAADQRSRYRVVLLDEYQDTGHAQVEMLRGLFGAGHPVTAVGDALQSIYGWRGASAGNMRGFAQRFAHADGGPAIEFALSTAFRNDRTILDVANAVASDLRVSDRAVELRPRDGAGEGAVAVALLPTVQDEATWAARRVAEAWAGLEPGERTAAVLVRRRSQMPLLADALRAEGLDVEIVGLGGLLTTPEVVDVVATLRVLGDHKASGALARLLTGARWRIGARDMWALRERAAQFVRPAEGADPEDREPLSLVEAVDDPGFEDRYSPEGWRRIQALRGELRYLRSRLGAPLTDLVAEVESVIGVGVEVLTRPDHAAVGRVHLDRFLQVAADFAAEAAAGSSATAGNSSLRAFLAYLDAAEDEENGLEAGEVEVQPERVQVITVHGAKGLEWDIVAVPGLVDKVFPAEPKSTNWTRTRQQLPGDLRGDRDSLPPLNLSLATSRKEIGQVLSSYDAEVRTRHVTEERRLAYVALTRAKTHLFVSGYAWDTAKEARRPSVFLDEIAAVVAAQEWFEPEQGAANPLAEVPDEAVWPLDPLRGRAEIEDGAALVRRARSAPGVVPVDDASPRVQEWRAGVTALIAEHSRRRVPEVIDVELPARLSVSDLVEVRRDPAGLARRLHRPVPTAPAPWTRRGTAFHAWLERKWAQATLLDIEELPGSADEFPADDARLLELQAAFEASPWAELKPAEVEVPFEIAIGATVIRGRMDAVFGSTTAGWHVVDWKTGSKPSGEAAHAAAIQLAAYRLAWAHLNAIPDELIATVRASFHYVATNETVSPTDLMTVDDLRALIAEG